MLLPEHDPLSAWLHGGYVRLCDRAAANSSALSRAAQIANADLPPASRVHGVAQHYRLQSELGALLAQANGINGM